MAEGQSKGDTYIAQYIKNECNIATGHSSNETNVEKPVEKISDGKLLDSTTGTLHEKLKEWHSNLKIPLPVWMKYAPVFPIEEYFIQLQLKSTNEEIQITDIFKDMNHKRILLEGKPGYGKTTLVTKIVNDWALSKSYLSNFKYLFLFQMKYLSDKTIDEGIIDMAKMTGLEDTKIQNNLMNNESKTLLIIDGLDESTPNQRENILKLLYKQIYSQMTVLVTSRTGYFTLNREEEKKLCKGIENGKIFFEKQIVVHGITQKNRKEFLRKFTALNEKGRDDVEQILQKFSSTNDCKTELFESPLLLLLLAEFMNERFKKKKDISNISITNFYKKIFNVIIRRFEDKKQKVCLENNFDLFIKNEVTKPYRELLWEFGSVSIDRILKNELTFDSTHLIKEIHKFGFLIRQYDIMFTRYTTSFEVFHLSILEFIVAFYLYEEFEKHNFAEIVCKMNEIFIQSGGTSLIFPFLMGLLKDKVVDFFKIMKSYSYLYSFNEFGLYEMVENISVDEVKEQDLIQEMQCFIPYKLDLAKCSSILWQKLISKKNEDDGADCIFVNIDTKSDLKLSTTVPVLWFICKDHKYVKKTLCNLALLPAKKRGLHCFSPHNETIELLLSDLKDENLKDFNINFFTCFTNTFEFINLTKRLLFYHQLTSLVFSTNNISLVTGIINLLYAPSNLNSLDIDNNSDELVFIDLNKLTNEGQKQWQYMCLRSVMFICNKPLQNSFSYFLYYSDDLNVTTLSLKSVVEWDNIFSMEGKCVKSLNITDKNQLVLQTIESLKNLSLSLLEIQFHNFFFAMKSEQWSRNSLMDLILRIKNELDSEKLKSDHFWQNLKSFIHLRYLEFVFEKNSEIHLPVDKILQTISYLPITHLSLWNIQFQSELVLMLIHEFKNSENTKIKRISLHTGENMSKSDEIVKNLLELLESKILEKFSLICSDGRDIWLMALFKAINKTSKKFCIKCNTLGSDDDDPNYSKIIHIKRQNWVSKQLSVTLT